MVLIPIQSEPWSIEDIVVCSFISDSPSKYCCPMLRNSVRKKLNFAIMNQDLLMQYWFLPKTKMSFH